MKNLKKTTKQYPVTRENSMKPKNEIRSDWKVDNFGVLIFDATKDVTEQTNAEVQYRRLLEDHTLRQVTDQRDANQETKSARMFFYSAMSVLLTVFFIALYLKSTGA